MDEPLLGRLVQGATRPSWTLTVYQSNNNPLDISGASYSGVLYNVRTQNRKTLGANYTTSDATNGIFVYAPAAADVDTAGLWVWETAITISGQTYYVRARLEILPRYAA